MRHVNLNLLDRFLLKLHGVSRVVNICAESLPLLLAQTYIPFVKQFMVRVVLRYTLKLHEFALHHLTLVKLGGAGIRTFYQLLIVKID